MAAEYTIFDRRNSVEFGRSIQPDESVKSEMAALVDVGFPRSDWHFAECEIRELSDDASREFVG